MKCNFLQKKTVHYDQNTSHRDNNFLLCVIILYVVIIYALLFIIFHCYFCFPYYLCHTFTLRFMCIVYIVQYVQKYYSTMYKM